MIKSWQAIFPFNTNSFFSDLAKDTSSAKEKSEESLEEVLVLEESKRLLIAPDLSINTPKDEDKWS